MEYTGHPEDYDSPEEPHCDLCGEPLEKDAMGHHVCVNKDCRSNNEEE